MKTDNIYIGEVYKVINEDGERKEKSIGFRSFIHIEEDTFIRLANRQVFSTNIEKLNCDSLYIKEESLITYNSFAKSYLWNLRSTVINNCRNKISDLVNEKIAKNYMPDYTEEEKQLIHANGELTLDEKVSEYLLHDVCPLSGKVAKDRCDEFQTCRECISESLHQSGERSFKKLEYKINSPINYTNEY